MPLGKIGIPSLEEKSLDWKSKEGIVDFLKGRTDTFDCFCDSHWN
jgi:hypothetical protein